MPHSLQLPWLFAFIIYCECQSQDSPGKCKHPRRNLPIKDRMGILKREPSMHSPGIFSAAPAGMMFCLTRWPPWTILHGFCLGLTLPRSNIWFITIFGSFFQIGLVKMVGRVPNLSSSACFVPPTFTSAGMRLPCHLGSLLYLILGPGYGCLGYSVKFASLLLPD